MMDNGKINILVTLDRNYIHCFNTILSSALTPKRTLTSTS